MYRKEYGMSSSTTPSSRSSLKEKVEEEEKDVTSKTGHKLGEYTSMKREMRREEHDSMEEMLIV